MSNLSARFAACGYWLGPGPPTIPDPFYGFQVYDIVEYRPESIASVILEIPGSREVHPASPSWWEWEAEWEQGDRAILMDDVYIFEDSGCWAQLGLTCDCELGDLLDLWNAIRAKHPAVWLFDDNERLFSPESFLVWWENLDSTSRMRDSM